MGSEYQIPSDVPVKALDCTVAFENLTDQEKLYAHHISRASWLTSRVVLLTTSSESPAIFALFQNLFAAQSIEEYASRAQEQFGVSEQHWKDFVTYAAAFYANMGNYKSFGDTKILPVLPKDQFKQCILASKANSTDKAQLINRIMDSTLDAIFDESPHKLQLHLDEVEGKSCSNYYSSNITVKDVEFVGDFLQEQDISPYNHRLFKLPDGVYEVRVASAETTEPKDYEFRGQTVRITYGDFAPLMKCAVDELTEASKYAANDTQKNMLLEYAKSFSTGSIDAHKEGSKYWIQDKGPVVESYIGFIESYRDPFGVRGEWEGFVAVVNKPMSKQFNTLVENAENLLPKLPWTSEFEKDRFLRPDFTSLDILSFAGSGVPAGINIPNYNDIRQDIGFKNVSLGNVLAAGYGAKSDEVMTHLGDEDQDVFKKLVRESFEVQVGLHELLGHGSGKLFRRSADGSLNCSSDLAEPLENKNVNDLPLYNDGETWESKFPLISSSYEECRAECVGVYLSCERDALAIFGHTEDADASDIMYVNWLNMARAGLMSMLFFNVEKGWGQAHMQARFAILQVMLEAGEGFVTVEERTSPLKKMNDNGESVEVDAPDVIVRLDREKILTVGKPAVGAFLRKLQVYKSTGNFEAAKAMYEKYTTPSAEFVAYRDIVVARRKPRGLLVQANTFKDAQGQISLKTYDTSVEGVIQSMLDRFENKEGNWDTELLELWTNDLPFTNAI